MGPSAAMRWQCLSAAEVRVAIRSQLITADEPTAGTQKSALLYAGVGSSGPPSVLLRAGLRWSFLRPSRGPIQMNRRIAGNVTTQVSRKKRSQPIFSDSTPPEEATTVRPSKVSEESRAYWVAVKAGEHRLE